MGKVTFLLRGIRDIPNLLLKVYHTEAFSSGEGGLRSKTDEENIFCAAQDGSPHPPLRGPPSPLEKANFVLRSTIKCCFADFFKIKKVLLKAGTTVASCFPTIKLAL